MKKIILSISILTLFIIPKVGIAQNVAINNDGSIANASAILDAKSTTKGLLIPRMSKAEKNAIVAPATGLLIFQNAPDSIGFYYYSGSEWTWISNANPNTAWFTTGNMGTDTAINFIGTRTTMPIRFKQNNGWVGQFDTNTENFYLGGGAGERNRRGWRNTIIGDSALALQSFNPGFNYVSDNTAIGSKALYANQPTSSTNGIKNVAIGNEAMIDNTIGHQNVAVGVSALRENTTGVGNTAIGRSAARLSKYGSYNNYIGFTSGYSDSTGSYNVGIGTQSMYTHQTGNNNIAIGYNTMYFDSSGANNTVIGASASLNNDTAKNVTAIGYRTLYQNNRSNTTALGAHAGYWNGFTSSDPTRGIENTMLGYGAMYGVPWGSKNVAVGNLAMANVDVTINGYATIAPFRNVAIGDSALYDNTGNDNVAIGFKAAVSQSNSNASQNIAIGSYAMLGNLTGASNVAVGYRTLNESEASNFNVAIGNDALLNHKRIGNTFSTAVGASALEQDSSGFQNTGVGTSSFRFNKTGTFNCGLGINTGYYQRGSNNTFAGAYSGYGERIINANTNLNTGSNNTGLGGGSLYSLANGNFNVAIGEDALYSDSSGSYNVALGNDALRNITTGNYNSSLGYNTDVSLGSLTNTTTIGAYSFATQSNSLILGSISGTNGATANANVGIGTTTPSARLDVDANFKLGNNGTILNEIIKSAVTYDIISLASGTFDSQIFPIANVAVGSSVLISPFNALPGSVSIAYARVSSAGNVEVKFVNAGNTTQDPANNTFYITVIR